MMVFAALILLATPPQGQPWTWADAQLVDVSGEPTVRRLVIDGLRARGATVASGARAAIQVNVRRLRTNRSRSGKHLKVRVVAENVGRPPRQVAVLGVAAPNEPRALEAAVANALRALDRELGADTAPGAGLFGANWVASAADFLSRRSALTGADIDGIDLRAGMVRARPPVWLGEGDERSWAEIDDGIHVIFAVASGSCPLGTSPTSALHQAFGRAKDRLMLENPEVLGVGTSDVRLLDFYVRGLDLFALVGALPHQQ